MNHVSDTAQPRTGRLGVQLPPPPSLEESHLRTAAVNVPPWGALEAFVPAHAPYVCDDPNAPALVLVPGLGMDGLGFLRQLPLGAFAHLHFVQVPNDPAIGECGLHCFARYVEDYIIAQKLDQHRGGVVLGGASMGGAMSLAIATRGRVKLRGLLLIGTFGSCQHLPRWQRAAAPLAHIIPFGMLRKLGWIVLGRTRLFGRLKTSESRWLISCRLPRNRKYFGHAVAALTRQEQISDAARLALPTLVLHGTRDNVLPFAAGEELARTIPNARFHVVKDSGHALFFTDHEEVNTAIARFLLDLPPRG
jgi:pimeloyl-ACP methyl ester carboxylesterase